MPTRLQRRRRLLPAALARALLACCGTGPALALSDSFVTIATGGTLTEILKDSVSLLLPVRPDDIRAVLKRLRVWSLLAGYRGAAPADIDALVAAVMAIASYVEATPQAVEVEVNPLLCGPRGAIAADALIRLGEQT